MKYTTKYHTEGQALKACINEFRSVMLLRLQEKMRKGYGGWDEESFWDNDDFEERMRQMIEEGRWIDLANMAMFQWNRE